jgi:hypothetical protein
MEGIRIADEMLILEELYDWRVSILFLHRNISMMFICFRIHFFAFRRKENTKIVKYFSRMYLACR